MNIRTAVLQCSTLETVLVPLPTVFYLRQVNSGQRMLYGQWHKKPTAIRDAFGEVCVGFLF